MRLVQGQQNKTKQVAGRLDREITGVASAPFQSFVALSGKRKDTGQRTSLAGQAAAAFIPAHVRDGGNSLTNFSLVQQRGSLCGTPSTATSTELARSTSSSRRTSSSTRSPPTSAWCRYGRNVARSLLTLPLFVFNNTNSPPYLPPLPHQLAVSTDASYVVVALENHVAICPLYCPQPALGMLLNKMKSTLSFAEEGTQCAVHEEFQEC